MKSKRGFTLVELLLVVIIMSVVATIAIPTFADSGRRAREARLRAYLRILREATNRFRADTTLWPQSSDLLNGTVPTQGYDDTGTLKDIPAGTYFGPYLDKSQMRIEIAGVGLGYGIGAPYQVGSWRLTGAGTAEDGTPFGSW